MAQSKQNNQYDFNLEKIPRFIRNRYFIIAFIFTVWIMFFDRSNLIDQFKLQQTLDGLEEKKSYYEREIGQVKRDKRELFSSDKALEKFARERYYMKKDNEDVFVIVEEE